MTPVSLTSTDLSNTKLAPLDRAKQARRFLLTPMSRDAPSAPPRPLCLTGGPLRPSPMNNLEILSLFPLTLPRFEITYLFSRRRDRHTLGARAGSPKFISYAHHVSDVCGVLGMLSSLEVKVLRST